MKSGWVSAAEHTKDTLLQLSFHNPPPLLSFVQMLPGTKKFDACNHVRAYEYYMESLAKPQGFVGYPCPNKDAFAEVSLSFTTKVIFWDDWN